jgi:RNA polymerase sigma-70 factor (ECF subfamily)
METQDDQELLSMLMSGSHDAFSVIYKKYWKKVFLFAYDRLQDTKQSQDIVQDIFVSLWERKAELAVENLNAYLYASVRYRILKLVDTEQARDHFFASLQHLNPSGSSADNSVISTELLNAYNTLVNKMPRQRRKILQLRYDEGLKTREIAELLGISQKTVQNQLLNSYQEIRSLLSRVLL